MSPTGDIEGTAAALRPADDRGHRVVPVQPVRLAQELGREAQLGEPNVVRGQVLDRLERDPLRRGHVDERALREGEPRQHLLQRTHGPQHLRLLGELGFRRLRKWMTGFPVQVEHRRQPDRALEMPMQVHLGDGFEIHGPFNSMRGDRGGFGCCWRARSCSSPAC
jgi:hypothetical protein